VGHLQWGQAWGHPAGSSDGLTRRGGPCSPSGAVVLPLAEFFQFGVFPTGGRWINSVRSFNLEAQLVWNILKARTVRVNLLNNGAYFWGIKFAFLSLIFLNAINILLRIFLLSFSPFLLFVFLNILSFFFLFFSFFYLFSFFFFFLFCDIFFILKKRLL